MTTVDFYAKIFPILYPCLENSTTGNAIMGSRVASDVEFEGAELTAGHLSEKNDNLAVQNEDCQWIAVGNVLVNFEQVVVKLNINKLYFIIKGFCSALEILSTSYKCQIDEWISFVIWSFSILMPKTSISWKSIWIYLKSQINLNLKIGLVQYVFNLITW